MDRMKEHKKPLGANANHLNMQTSPERERKAKALLTLGGTLGALTLFASCASSHKAPISEGALRPYSPDLYPEYASRYEEIDIYRAKAADIASRNPECKEVTFSDLSNYESSLDELHFFVDCNKGRKRFRFTETELDGNTKAVSETDKALSRTQAVSACSALIERNAEDPSSVDINRMLVTYQKFDQTGNTRVSLKFQTSNSFGIKQKYNAVCTFRPANTNGEIRISKSSR